MMAMQSSILASTMHSKGILDAGDAAWLKRACLGTAKGRLVLRALFALAWIANHAALAKMLSAR